jgi:hypothetical protein
VKNKGLTARNHQKRSNLGKRKCKSYYNAKQNLKDIKRQLERKRTRFLGKLIKTTLRNILSRILGCKFLRIKRSILQQVRKVMKKIRNKVISLKSVRKFTDFFKSMVNYNQKKRVIKKTKKVVKKILLNFLKRKKLSAKTMILMNRLI